MGRKSYWYLIIRILLFLVFLPNSLFAQEYPCYSLDAVLSFYTQTNDYIKLQADSIVQNNKRRLFKIKTLPSFSLQLSTPNIINNITPIVQPDGSELFNNRFNASTNVSISASQLLPFTGGTITATSSLVRFDNIIPTKNTSYNLNLINLSYNQTLSGYNAYKWEKRQFEVEDKNNTIQRHMEKERILSEITSLFFELYVAQEEYRALEESEKLAAYIYEKSSELYMQGRLSYEDYLDAQIEYKRTTIRKTDYAINNARERLRTYLNLSEPTFSVQFDLDRWAMSEFHFVDDSTLARRVIYYSIGREREVEEIANRLQLKRIKAEKSPLISLSIGGGVNTQSEEFKKIFNSFNSRLNVSFSISLPIVDWGKNKLQYENKLESIRIQELNYSSREKQIYALCTYDMAVLSSILTEIKAEKDMIELLYLRIEKLKENVSFGKIDSAEISRCQTRLIQAQIQNINRLQQLFSIIYRYRVQALYDIRTGKYLSN